MIIHAADGITVSTRIDDGLVLIGVFGKYITVTPEELADIADAVAQYLESAAEIPCPDLGEWDPQGGGG